MKRQPDYTVSDNQKCFISKNQMLWITIEICIFDMWNLLGIRFICKVTHSSVLMWTCIVSENHVTDSDNMSAFDIIVWVHKFTATFQMTEMKNMFVRCRVISPFGCRQFTVQKVNARKCLILLISERTMIYVVLMHATLWLQCITLT